MNDNDASAHRRLALERPEIRRLIERFEEALLAGDDPRIEDAVPADLPEGMLILEELLHVEIEFRGKRQEAVALPKYLGRFPQIGADAHAVGRLRETVRRFVSEAQADKERAMLDVTKSQPAPAGGQVPFGRIALQSEFIDSDQPVGGHGGRGADSMATGAAAGTTGLSGRFHILRPHAKGGLGQVSVALDRDLNREVALKEIQQRHADDQISRQRFLVEAEITGRLEHPGIVPVYALGHDPDGRPFYVMRFVKGDSLKQAIDQFHQANNPNRSDPGARHLALRQLLGRFIDVCNAVEYAHSRGVLHRDLKPGNIMVGKYGETLVVDWGLAKTVGSREAASRSEETSLRPLSASSSLGHTEPGSAVGTPAYMSPEQAAGNLDVIGPASDVYSLGATLYHLLTGVPPFDRESVAHVLRKVRAGGIRKPRAVQRQIPAALEAICMKAMAVSPRDRYTTPRLLADDLEHWLADEPVGAAPERFGERLSRIGRRHRGAVRAGAAAVVMVALVSIVAALLINSARHDALDLAGKNKNLALEKGQLADEKGRLAEKNAALAFEEREARAAEARQAALARQRAAELRRSLYLSDLNRVEQYARVPNVERMRALLARHVPKENEEDLRGFDWLYWWNFIHGDRLCLEGDEPVQKVAASPDGRTIAIACAGGWLHLVDSRTGQRRRQVLTLPAENCAALRFTGDGKQLVAVGAKGAIKAWNAETGQVICDRHAGQPPEQQAREQCSRWPAAISADGRTILAQHPKQEVQVMGKWSGPSCLYLADLSTGLYIGTSGPPGEKSREADPLAGAMLRFTDHSRIRRQTHSIDIETAPGELPPIATNDPTGAHFWPSRKDASAPPPEEWGAPIFGLALSPSGKWFADGGRDGLVRLWNSETLVPERTLASHEGIVWDVAFSADEQYLASAGSDGLVIVWNISSGQPVARCRGGDRPVRSVVFLPGDRRVAAAGDDGAIRIWTRGAAAPSATFTVIRHGLFHWQSRPTKPGPTRGSSRVGPMGQSASGSSICRRTSSCPATTVF